MNKKISEKYRRLESILKTYGKVAVAYSGGVDSSLLAWASVRSVGPDNVLILHASTCLLSKITEDSARSLLVELFPDRVRRKIIDLDPLENESFVANPAERCYICKKTIYTSLLKEVSTEGFPVLADGTNIDDLSQDRPGLKAIEELGIKMPLVEAGFTKTEIREAARVLKLPNADLPANSCLATRIEPGKRIDIEKLFHIDRLEVFMIKKGYQGCRVRPREREVVIEVQKADLERIMGDKERAEIRAYFQENGYTVVLLNIAGR